jgi:hypothetical protein
METLILLGILIAGLGLMIGVLSPKRALILLMLTIISAVLLPFINLYIKNAPTWLVLIIIVVLILLLFQLIVCLIFGKQTAASATGNIIANLVLLPFKLLIELLKALLFRKKI